MQMSGGHILARKVVGCFVLFSLARCSAFAQSTIPPPPSALQTEVSFRNDVMAVLSKAGCNAGTCHGNKNGKGGFKLSLRGQDPDIDYLTLTRDSLARRINPLEPEESLMLLKPNTQVAHEGGLRFKKGSEEYEILRRWIADGMPNDVASAPKLEHIEVAPRENVSVEPAREVQLRVRARFSDGSSRDVTSLAVYEPANGLAKVSHDGLVERQGMGETTVLVRYLHCQEPVRLIFVPARPNFVWQQQPADNYIDEHIFATLRTLRMNPSRLCSDEVFLRRAYLDLLGILPTADEAHAFVSDDTVARAARKVRPTQEWSHRDQEPTPNPSTRGERASGPADPFPVLGGGRGGLLDRRNPSPAEISAGSLHRRLQKRARLIDRLLERPEFADFWALKWADLLRVEAHSLDKKGVQNFHHWIRESIAVNKPLDQFVRELITARGSTYSSPAANFYRPNRDPATRAKAAAQVFLGTRLQCAECHNHPFDRWTQDDYYDWADLFARVKYKVIENKREISSDEHEWNGEQIVFVARQGSVKNLRTGKEAQPRFLGDPLISRRAGEAEKANEPGSNPSQAGERARARPHDVPPSAGDRRGS